MNINHSLPKGKLPLPPMLCMYLYREQQTGQHFIMEDYILQCLGLHAYLKVLIVPEDKDETPNTAKYNLSL